MDKTPELWAFILANLGLFIISSLFTGLCFFTYYRSNRNRSFAIATAGFSLIVIGGLIEPLYVFGISTNDTLNITEIFLMQGSETILLALGLGFLFYSIAQYRSDTASEEEEQYDLSDQDLVWNDSD